MSTRAGRGFSLIELMAASAIVGLAILASTGFMMRRAQMTRQVSERVRIDQALASEMETQLAEVPRSLEPGERAWRSGADVALRIEGARGVVRVTMTGPRLRLVQVELTWTTPRHAPLKASRERIVELP
jgi:prepilin-type N-terminal cleavage/methylation domain-containing protein